MTVTLQLWGITCGEYYNQIFVLLNPRKIQENLSAETCMFKNQV